MSNGPAKAAAYPTLSLPPQVNFLYRTQIVHMKPRAKSIRYPLPLLELSRIWRIFFWGVSKFVKIFCSVHTSFKENGVTGGVTCSYNFRCRILGQNISLPFPSFLPAFLTIRKAWLLISKFCGQQEASCLFSLFLFCSHLRKQSGIETRYKKQFKGALQGVKGNPIWQT